MKLREYGQTIFLGSNELIKRLQQLVGPVGVGRGNYFNVYTDPMQDFCSFNETKRMSQNYYAIYEASGTDKTINRISDWMYQVTEP